MIRNKTTASGQPFAKGWRGTRRSDISTKQAWNYLEQMVQDCKSYRVAIDRLFSWKLARPRDCRRYFGGLLTTMSRLYLDSLIVKKEIPALRAFCHPIGPGAAPRDVWGAQRFAEIASKQVLTEKVLRQRLNERLASRLCWSFFEPRVPFAESIRLETLQDYLDSFGLHLPEIYSGTLQVESYVRSFRKKPDTGTLVDLELGLTHMSRNHISFVHFAIEWVSDEATWTD